jgi:hypothetical protein
MIPKVNKLEDILPAMAALEKTSMQENKDETGLENLNTHAKRMSARAVVEAYKKEKPQSKDEFIRFIQNLPYRFSRVGFTGEPYSEVNAMLAQIAWACEPGSQESFWKILYPEITGVIDGDSNTLWPRYGEAILSESLAEKKLGSILNYRQLWKKAETAPIQLIEETKVSGFCPAHRDYWLEVVTRRKNGSSNHPESKLVFKTEFNNYYEFFDSMRAFMNAYKATQANGWEDDVGSSPEGLQVMLDFRAYQEVILNAPKNLKAIFNSIDQLSSVLQNVVGEKTGESFTVRIRGSCFATNSHTLKNILSRDAVKEILSSIPFEPKSIASPEKEHALIEGHDGLFYLPEHTRQLRVLSEDSLIDLVKRHENYGLELSVLVDLYRPILDSSACKTQKLFNTLYQCSDYDLEAEFIKHIFDGRLNFIPVVNDFRDCLYGIYLLERIQKRVQAASEDEDENLLDQLVAVIEKRLEIFISLHDELEKVAQNDLDKVIWNIDVFQKSLSDLKYLGQIKTKLKELFPMKLSNSLDHFMSTNYFFPTYLSGQADRKIVRVYVVANLMKFSEKYSGNPGLEDKLINLFERVNGPTERFNGDDRTETILGLYKRYHRMPRLRSKIIEALTSESLMDFMTKRREFDIDLARILSGRNFFSSISRLISLIRCFKFSANADVHEHIFLEWLKDHLKSPDEIAHAIHFTRVYDVYLNARSSPLFKLFIKNDFMPIHSYADFLKIYHVLILQQEKELFSDKYPNFKKRPPTRLNEDYSQIIPLWGISDFFTSALSLEDTHNGVESFFRYFLNEFTSLMTHDDYLIRMIFIEVSNKYGFDQTIAQFNPLFRPYFKEHPYKIVSFLGWSSHTENLKKYFAEIEINHALISMSEIVEVMSVYPTHRKNIIENTLKHFNDLSETGLGHFKKYFPILTTDEMKLFFEKGLSAERLLSIIDRPAQIAPKHKFDFKIRLFDAIPLSFLREHNQFLAYIVDPENVSDKFSFIMDGINKSPRLAECLDLFMNESQNESIRRAAVLISRDHTRQPFIISPPSKVQKLNQDSDVHRQAARPN